MMSHDLNAAIRGAQRAGATTIVAKDSHGNSKNLLIEDLEPGVELVSGHGAGTDGMMQGIDSSFDAALLVGYHAMAGTTSGVMEHTITGGIHRLHINGQELGEIGLSAGVAGSLGVPLVMVSSDDAGCVEASQLIPGIVTASTKTGIGRYMAQLKHPSETVETIENAAFKALSTMPTKPWLPTEPCVLQVEFNRSEEADFCCKLLGMSRINGFTVEAKRDTYGQIHQVAWNLIAMSFEGIGSQH